MRSEQVFLRRIERQREKERERERERDRERERESQEKRKKIGETQIEKRRMRFFILGEKGGGKLSSLPQKIIIGRKESKYV